MGINSKVNIGPKGRKMIKYFWPEGSFGPKGSLAPREEKAPSEEYPYPDEAHFIKFGQKVPKLIF